MVAVLVEMIVEVMVVGDGAAVRMQEQTLLSLEARYEVVAGRSRFAFTGVAMGVVLWMREYGRSDYRLDGSAYVVDIVVLIVGLI